LSSVEGGNRVNNDYLDQLARFHKQNGHNLNRFPSVDKRPLDLYRLKKTVERKGGFESVCKGKRWAEVGRDLGYSGKIMSSLSTSLKNSYQKWLLPYEDYLRLAKPGVHQQMEMLNGGPYTPSPGPSPAKKSQTDTPPAMNQDTPTMKATAALHSSINGPSSQPTPPSMPPAMLPDTQTAPAPPPPPQPAPPTTGGFTPVNAGGFTAVNAATPSTSFTSVNGVHSNSATPQQATATPPANNIPPQIAPHPNGVPTLKRQHSDSILSQDEIDAMNRRSKRLRQDVPTVAGSNMHHSRMAASRFQPLKDRGNLRPGEMCENCGKADDKLKFVGCLSCDSTYHMYCLEPPLKQMPDYEWHCPKCLVGTNEYGFEEGDVYSLTGFQRKANEFKAYHFNSLPPQFSPFHESKRFLDEFDVEREFWRLVENINDSTEVEYGADIHSTTHGSGFPTVEKQPRDPYSADPWNLNILPLDKESLFRHIKSDISGMTVPWLYVGMVFSTFCWHNEDHFAYSANYQHFGQTKTWYGIPAEDTEKFEAAMRDEVPELFETQPDILFQLVTLAKPEKLRKAGVRVFALDQRAGQFVITFPQAYHAGFNHGFNFNEAVNFAPQDWEPFGEAGAKRLRDYRKQPCFSHDELLLSAASRDHTIRTAKWLAPALERMLDEELAARKNFISGPDPESGTAPKEPYLGPRYEAEPEIIDPETEEEEVICLFCKCYCYLSRVKCAKTGKYMCMLHAGNFACCDALEHERYTGRDGTHTLSLRLTDDALTKTVSKVVEKANIPETWSAKVDAELDENPRPSLKHLRTLLSEGDKIQYDLPQLPDLRRFVERCNEWVEEATSYITRKQQNRRKNEKAWRKNTAKAQEMEDREKELRNVENIHRLLASADEISFDCAEINTLRERSENIKEFRREANLALENINNKKTEEFQELVDRGRDFHVDISEIELLEGTLKRLRWNDRVAEMKPSSADRKQHHTLDEIEKFIAEGQEVGVPDSNMDLQYFMEHRAQGELWEEKAKEVMAAEQVHYQQLDSLSAQAISLAVRADTRAAVDAILKKQREVQDKIHGLVDRSKNEDFRLRPKYKELKDVMDIVEELQSKPSGTIDLEKEQRKHEDWMRRGKKLFGKANAPLHILLQHMKQVRERNDSCFEITDKPRAPAEPSSRHVTPVDGVPISDGSNSSRDVFCICRKPEAGMMIECEVCHEWYHGKCLKIARGKVKEDDKYTCPICDWRVKIPRDAARPKLEDLQEWRSELGDLPFQPEEEETLVGVCEHAQNYRDFIRPIIHSDLSTSPEEVATMRFHLRKIEGADIMLQEETNFLRQELHKWAPVAPNAPPHLEHSGSTRKPRPTKQQKLMAQFGITNPDDLPHQYKIKPHVAKRKASEAMTKGQMPLQPAGNSASPVESQPPPANFPTPNPATSLPPGEKRFLTPLALHVLESLCEAPVVSQMLKVEPHMNRDKLSKMKILLETDRTVWDDLPAFQRKMKEMPTPSSHTPAAFTFDAPQAMPESSSAHQDSPLFQTTSGDPYPVTSQQQGLASIDSPARYGSPSGFQGQTTPPPHHGFDASMFDAPDGSMFDSPSAVINDTKPPVDGMFESPKVSGYAGLGSPGFGGSQQSVGGNIDHVFEDLVNDHEVLPAFDGSGEVKEGDASAPFGAENGSGDVEMADIKDPPLDEQMDQDRGSSLQQLAEQTLGMSGFGDEGAE
jgi:histone demethylase JARID1